MFPSLTLEYHYAMQESAQISPTELVNSSRPTPKNDTMLLHVGCEFRHANVRQKVQRLEKARQLALHSRTNQELVNSESYNHINQDADYHPDYHVCIWTADPRSGPMESFS